MYAKFDDERAGAGIPLPEGEPVTLGRAQIPAGIVSPLHRTQVSRKHVQLTRRGDTVSLEVVRGGSCREFEATRPALPQAGPPQISATHAVLVRKFGAEHASWRKLDPHSLEELAVGDGFALHPGVDRPVAFRLVDGAESPQDLDAGESAGVGSEATPREGVPASAEGAEAPTPGVGGLAEKRPRPGASEGHSSGQPRGRSEEDSPPHRRRRKVTFHPEASVAGAAAEDGTTRLRDAPSPAPTPSPLPRHPTSATAAPGGTDGGRGGPAERAVPAGDTEASATARPSAGAPVPAPTSGGGETAEESPQRPSPASSAAIPTADVPAWGGGRGTEVLEGRWRTTRGDEVHATVLVDGANALSPLPLPCVPTADR